MERTSVDCRGAPYRKLQPEKKRSRTANMTESEYSSGSTFEVSDDDDDVQILDQPKEAWTMLATAQVQTHVDNSTATMQASASASITDDAQRATAKASAESRRTQKPIPRRILTNSQLILLFTGKGQYTKNTSTATSTARSGPLHPVKEKKKAATRRSLPSPSPRRRQERRRHRGRILEREAAAAATAANTRQEARRATEDEAEVDRDGEKENQEKRRDVIDESDSITSNPTLATNRIPATKNTIAQNTEEEEGGEKSASGATSERHAKNPVAVDRRQRRQR